MGNICKLQHEVDFRYYSSNPHEKKVGGKEAELRECLS